MLAQARAYKGELIQFIMAGDAIDSLDIGLNLIFNMRDLGYDHWFAHGGRDNSTCIRLLAALPNAGAMHIKRQTLFTYILIDLHDLVDVVLSNIRMHYFTCEKSLWRYMSTYGNQAFPAIFVYI